MTVFAVLAICFPHGLPGHMRERLEKSLKFNAAPFVS